MKIFLAMLFTAASLAVGGAAHAGGCSTTCHKGWGDTVQCDTICN